MVYSKMCAFQPAGVEGAFLPATLTLGLTVSLFYVLFGDIIWLLLNQGLCNTERFVIIELTDVKRTG